MSPEERARTVKRLESMALPDELILAMAEGDLHLDAKITVRDTLRTYFSKSGRRIYVAAELAVFYPGHPVFSPDILAVRDVDPHPRNSWIVSAEGKGLDLVLEVISEGDRRKDLVDNLERYAALGIEEYFVLDLPRRSISGHRLPSPRGRGGYQRLVPQAGLLGSSVLGLDLGMVEGRLCFYQGNAQLLTAQDLAAKLERMVDELVAKQDEERTRLESEQALRAEEQARREALERQLRGGILAILAARGLTAGDDERARILATEDPDLLGRWMVRAAAVASVAELFTDG